MNKQKILNLVEESIDLPKIVNFTLDEILEPALKKMVESTSNPFDDKIMEKFHPELEAKLKELIVKLWDKVDGEEG